MTRGLRIVMASLLLAVPMTAGACASNSATKPSRTGSSSAPAVLAARALASRASTRSIDQAVRADADRMMSDIASAPVEILLSSNPYSYVGVSPAFERLVARGTPAVEAIAREIEKSEDSGLREYLLAMAASRILNEPDSGESWSTAREWVTQYRSRN